MSDSISSASRQIARAAGIVMVGFILSSLTGLANQVLISHAFGTSAELDAFFAANRLTEILFNLMAGGALASAFLPTFTGFLTRDDRVGAWRLASSIANLITVALATLCALAWLTAPWLVQNILAPGFQDPAQVSLTVDLLRVMLISPLIFGVSGLLMATLNAHQHFALPALAPAAYRLGIFIGIWTLVPNLGIYGLAWGVILGSALHFLVQLPALFGIKPQYQWKLGLGNPAVRQVGRLMAPRLIGVAVVQLNFLVNTIIASGQPEGSLTAITFAFQIMIMPQTVIAQAIAIAALPTFSAQFARGELPEMRASLANTLRGIVFLSLPASVGLIMLRRPVIELLLQRGEFTAGSTELVAWALLWYAAGLVGHSVLEIIARAYYAMHDTRTPVVVGALAMSLNLVLSIVLSTLFANIGWMPHGGLALANSFATALECLTLLWLMRRRLGGLDMARLKRGLLASIGATTVMAVTLGLWTKWMGGAWIGTYAGGGIAIGLAAYWLFALLFGAPDARQLPRLLLKRGK